MFKSLTRKLADYIPAEYHGPLCEAAQYTKGMTKEAARALLFQEIELFPETFQRTLDQKLSDVGRTVVTPVPAPLTGAGTKAFNEASNDYVAPLSGIGPFRLAENGRLYFAAKSEHYHIPLGHSFPGYDLIETAKKLGVGNATHNNTRGILTRMLERELVRHANGIADGDEEGLQAVIRSTEPQKLNRVLNVNTGSLACEAGLKLMLSHFYRSEGNRDIPENAGLTPVILCIGDYDGGRQANYHGTTITGQMLRGLWPEYYAAQEKAGLIKMVGVSINDIDDFKAKFETYNRPPYKVAGFTSEIILMNYSAIKLQPEYLREVYDICHRHHVPVMCDEVQSGAWYKELFLFRKYGLTPDIVIIGKGFPGGHYSASKMITTAEFDNLSLFGALITNGQEELSSLVYLITMDFIVNNGAMVDEMGGYIEQEMRALAARHPQLIERFEGLTHLNGLIFRETENAVRFSHAMNERCIDVSAQTYKANCPPTALVKMPLICTRAAVDFFVRQADEVLKGM